MRAKWILGLACLAATASVGLAQTVGGPWAASYSIELLGAVPGLPGAYGGLSFAHDDPSRLLVGGAANTSLGAVYSVRVERDGGGRVVGFEGAATKLADAPFIDGGLAYAPNGVLLYTAFPINFLGQIRPGASGPSKTVLLSGLGVGGSVGGCAVATTGTGATRLKLTSPGASRWYDAPLIPDGQGTFDVGLATPRGPLAPSAGGVAFVTGGQPAFALDTALVSSCNGFVGAYSLDSNRDIVASLGSFVLGIAGCPDGLTVDPLTGDLFIAVFDLRRVYVVRGFTGVARYCAASELQNSCSPSISASGSPTLGGPDDFVVRATHAPAGASGLQIWSSAPTQVPFYSAFLCVAPPLRRIAVPAGPATGPCAGLLEQPWSHSDLAAAGLTPGTAVFTQFAIRNPAGAPAVLFSDALRFTVAP